jgi:ribonuclease HI
MHTGRVFGVFDADRACVALCKRRAAAEGIAAAMGVPGTVVGFPGLARGVGACAAPGTSGGSVERAAVARLAGGGKHAAAWHARLANEGVVEVHADGACRGNGTPNAVAGVGVYLHEASPHNVSDALPGHAQTNQRAELHALIRALEMVTAQPPELAGHTFQVFSDSAYALGCAQAWGARWAALGYVTSSGGAVANEDLIRPLVELVARARPSLKGGRLWKVAGHAGDVGNAGADALAVAGASRARPVPAR